MAIVIAIDIVIVRIRDDVNRLMMLGAGWSEQAAVDAINPNQGQTTSASLGHLQPRGIKTNDDMTISEKYILQENLRNALL